jgi:hemolysin activation/secretion protein
LQNHPPGRCAQATLSLSHATVAALALASSFVPLPAAAQPAAAASVNVEETLLVKDFEVVGNTLLPAALLARELAPFKGNATLQRLRDAAAAVQDVYRRVGFGGVVAFLPEQKPAEGVVRVRVVEGRLGRVELVDNNQFSSDNIRASLPGLVPGSTPNVRLIDAQIQIANENPAKTVQVLLQPGTEPATVVARVTVAEQPVSRFNTRLDNTGSERTGRWRAALGWQHANVAGQDQVFSAEFQTAPDQPKAVAVASGAWRVPLYARAMAMDFYGAWSDVDAGKAGTAAGELQFSGRGTIAGVRATHYLPRVANVDQRVSLGIELRDYRNHCAIDGLPQGACGAAGASVAVQPLGLQYIAQTVGEIRAGVSFGVQHNLGFGLAHSSADDFGAVRPGAQRGYTVWRASGNAALDWPAAGSLALRTAAQYSSRALVTGESFGLGGAQSVRGYEERELGGDSGVQATVEFASPNVATSMNRLGLQQADLRWLVFGDAGWIANRQADDCLPGRSRCHVAAIGVGLRLSWQQLQVRLDLAHALSNAVSTVHGDRRAHFGLAYGF